MAELQANPEYVAARERREAESKQRDAEYRKAEVPLLDALSQVGLSVKSVWELVNTSAPYPAAVPILLDHFERPYPDGIREGIGRALGVRAATPSWARLIELYRKESEGRAKDGIAVAIGAIAGAAGPQALEDVMAILRDRSNGDSRLFVLQALKYINSPLVESSLRELGHDTFLAREVASILRTRFKA